MKKKVLVGISGGVDSATSAYLLKKKGFDVTGITIKLFDSEKMDTAIIDGKKVCEILEIPHLILDFRNEFQDRVVKYFYDEYLSGRTPNPCVRCNIEIKFGILYDYAVNQGFDYLSTGHYVNVKYNEMTEEYMLLKGEVEMKDQSYFLYHLDQVKLSKMVFPLAEIKSKDQTRMISEKIGRFISEKKDSQGICFIDKENYQDEIASRIGCKKGFFVDVQGKVLGEHDGYYKFTIGQKRKLGIKLLEPLTVLAIDSDTGNILLGEDELAYSDGCELVDYKFNTEYDKYAGKEVSIKICQWGYYIKCQFAVENDRIIVKFKEAQRAVAKGQHGVLYIENRIIGGGKIV